MSEGQLREEVLARLGRFRKKDLVKRLLHCRDSVELVAHLITCYTIHDTDKSAGQDFCIGEVGCFKDLLTKGRLTLWLSYV